VTPATIALLAVALLFAVYVIVQVRPLGPKGARGASSAIRAAHARARDATSAEARAGALVEAGEVAAKARRWVSAAGSFLRALRADPTSADVVRRTASALAPRPRLLESVMLRKVAAVEATGASDPALVAALEALHSLYAAKRDKGRARLVERLLERERAPVKSRAD
jgi:hypothetical protein